MQQLVSIIMPAYNCEEYIKESIESVLKQDYKQWELLIINDCSSDATLDKIYTFTDSRIKVFLNTQNLGVAKSRNIGLNHARGRYIAFLDSDDIWLPQKITLQLSILRINPKAVCCHSSYIRMDEKGNDLSLVKALPVVTLDMMRKSNFIGNLTGVIDLSKIDLIKQKNVRHEDYVMWLAVLRAKSSGFSIGIEDALAKYRVRRISLSSNKLRSLLWHWRILRIEENLNFILATYYLLNYIFFAIKKRK